MYDLAAVTDRFKMLDAESREGRMSARFPFRLLESPSALASCQSWTEGACRDPLAFQADPLSHTDAAA